MNGHVFVPVPADGAAANWNDEAIAVYEEAMPGYQIHAVENTTAPSWQSTDALHCRTHEVADVEMLHIYHSALNGLYEPGSDFEISADIVSYGGYDLIADSLRVYYRVNHGNWQYEIMTNETGNTYTASIPEQSAGDSIEYIIRASDVSDRTESHPYIGFPDPHMFVIDGSSESVTQHDNPVISCFPNPVKDQLNLALHHFANEEAELIITDINGKTVRHISLDNADDWTLLKINVDDLPAGTYMIRVIGERSFATSKFVRQ